MTNLEVHGTEDDATEAPFHAQRTIGSRTGLINHLIVRLIRRDEPKAIVTRGEDTNLSVLFDRSAGEIELSNSGKGWELTDSIMGYVGETIERYCLMYKIPEQDIPYLESTYSELHDTSNVVDIDYLNIHSKEQRDRYDPVKELGKSTEIGWAAGTNLITGERTYAPGAAISMSPESYGQEYFLTFSNSNGCACGRTLREAITNSIYEYVERDAFMMMWYSQEQPTRISLDEYPELQQQLDELENDSTTYHLFEYDTEHAFHVIGCAMESHDDIGPKFYICGSAHLDFVSAVEDALVEAAQGVAWIHDIAFHWLDAEIPEREMLDLTKNVANYLKPSEFSHVEFILRGDVQSPSYDRREFESEAAELSAQLEALKRMNCTPIGFDLTTTDAKELGLSVGRVFIPELVSLSIPALPPLGHPRFDGVNTTDKPHPYP